MLLSNFVIIATTLAATSASALHLASKIERTGSLLHARDGLPRCDPVNGQTGILSPATGAVLTVDEPFLFSFCSPRYAKEGSKEIFIGFEDSDVSSAYLIKADVKYDQYTQNLTIDNYLDFHPGDKKLVVYEVSTGYYHPYNFQAFTIPVTVLASNQD
ncbi:hypothetical protein OC845_005970 [Tilletia horrida]|nr:hypothetical protein OC845_005970 [Tilletia horrida]